MATARKTVVAPAVAPVTVEPIPRAVPTEEVVIVDPDPRTKEQKKADEKAAAANDKVYPARPYSEAVTPEHRARLEARGVVIE